MDIVPRRKGPGAGEQKERVRSEERGVTEAEPANQFKKLGHRELLARIFKDQVCNFKTFIPLCIYGNMAHVCPFINIPLAPGTEIRVLPGRPSLPLCFPAPLASRSLRAFAFGGSLPGVKPGEIREH